MTVTIGVDIGTTAVKAVAATDDGTVVATTRVEHRHRSTESTVEHDARAAWHDGVLTATAAVAEHAASAGHRVAAVDVAAMVPSLCPVDAHGVPVGPGLLYGDPRAGGGPRGADPSTSGELARMLSWLVKEHPTAARYWPAQAVASAALCGRGAIDDVTSMTASPLARAGVWDEAEVASCGARTDQLPAIVRSAETVGRCTARLGTRLAGVPVGGGTIDAFGEQLVAGADEVGDVLVILGATLIVWAVVPEWIEPTGLWTVPHTAPGKVLVGGPSNAGALFRSWAASRLRRPDGREAELAADELDPDDVPLWLPYLRGERTPLHDPDRRAELHDATMAHGPAALWRAVDEATGFVVRRHLDLAGVLPNGTAPGSARRIVVTGGGSRDRGWVRALADVTGLPVERVAVAEGGALGAAYLARVVAGLEPDASGAARWARTGERIEPDPRWAEATTARYGRFVELSGPPFDHRRGER